MSEAFAKFYHQVVQNPNQRFNGKLLALDPGETTGAILFDCSEVDITIAKRWQIPCMPIEKGCEALEKAIVTSQPDRIVYEDYKVYGWKSAHHSWSALNTPKLIGAITLIARQQKIPISNELAQQPKGFVTDDKLNEWGYYERGMKHARDASRHGLFFLLFRYPKLAQKVTKI